MPDLLIDSTLRDQLHKEGYVKFPLFDEKQLREINEFYSQISEEHNVRKDTKFHTTLNTSNTALIAKVNAFLRPIFEKALKKHLTNNKYTIAGFLVKEPGDNSEVTLHQDWTFVDEENYESYNLWVPLVDVDANNGNMQFIPGSHRFAHTLRVSPDLPTYYESYRQEAMEYLKDVECKAGECVIFHQGIIHGSRPNLSNEPRVVSIISTYSEDAQLLHYHIPPGHDTSNIEQYAITTDSLVGMTKDEKPPHAELLGTVSYTPPEIDLNTFRQLCKPEPTFFEKIKAVIGYE